MDTIAPLKPTLRLCNFNILVDNDKGYTDMNKLGDPFHIRPANISNYMGLASKDLAFGIDPVAGYASNILYPESPLQVFCSTKSTLWRYDNTVKDPTEPPPYNYAERGTFEEPLAIRDHGSELIHNFFNAAVPFNNGTSGKGTCQYGGVYQNELGLLNAWGSSYNGTGSGPDVGQGTTQFTGAVALTWIKDRE